MCHRYPNAIEVNIVGAPFIHLLVLKAAGSLRNLESLTLGRGQLGDAFFHALFDCTMLKSLNVSDATFGNGIHKISINHDRLRHLKLTKCRVMRISIRCPQLQTLSLKHSNMAHALLNSPPLWVLDIGSCHKLTDAAVCLATMSCPQLESLDMSNCTCVSDETLGEIAQTCANFHILNASYFPNMLLESVRLPMLTVLKLHSCEGASMAAISSSSMLEIYGFESTIRARMLSSIMVSNCHVLHRIIITSNSLLVCLTMKCILCSFLFRVSIVKGCFLGHAKISIAEAKELNIIGFAVSVILQEVDLTDCESLTSSICEVFELFAYLL